jgi:hypothetical protein
MLTDHELVSRSPVFARLDNHINDQEKGASFLRAGEAGESRGFGSVGPFAGDRETELHWTTDWIQANGHGGSYWPYATDVDLKTLLKNGATESVQIATNTGKIHNTLWICNGDPPEEYQERQPVPKAKQEQLFKVAVHETDQVISLVILTPRPV